MRRSKSEAAVKRVGMLSVGFGALLMARGAAAQGIGTHGFVDEEIFVSYTYNTLTTTSSVVLSDAVVAVTKKKQRDRVTNHSL